MHWLSSGYGYEVCYKYYVTISSINNSSRPIAVDSLSDSYVNKPEINCFVNLVMDII